MRRGCSRREKAAAGNRDSSRNEPSCGQLTGQGSAQGDRHRHTSAAPRHPTVHATRQSQAGGSRREVYMTAPLRSSPSPGAKRAPGAAAWCQHGSQGAATHTLLSVRLVRPAGQKEGPRNIPAGGVSPNQTGSVHGQAPCAPAPIAVTQHWALRRAPHGASATRANSVKHYQHSGTWARATASAADGHRRVR